MSLAHGQPCAPACHLLPVPTEGHSTFPGLVHMPDPAAGPVVAQLSLRGDGGMGVPPSLRGLVGQPWAGSYGVRVEVSHASQCQITVIGSVFKPEEPVRTVSQSPCPAWGMTGFGRGCSRRQAGRDYCKPLLPGVSGSAS